MSEAKKDLQAERLVLHKNSLRESDSSHTLRMTVKNELDSADDATRNPEWYDGIYGYLKDVGIEEI